jgi:molecular chaperone GrpE
MSGRGRDHKDRKTTNLRKPSAPGDGSEEEPIEILEVVGVDETTGAEMEDRSGAAPRPAERAPGAGRSRALEEALQEKEKYYDLLLRKQAEFENFRKRMEKERDEFRRSAALDLVKDLLPVIDNLERALGTGQGSDDPLHRGVALIHQQVLEILKREGLQALESLGTPFDPRHHEAVEVLNVPGLEPGMVLEEVQKGYMFKDRLLRPALVKVSAGPRSGQTDPGGPGTDHAENGGNVA